MSPPVRRRIMRGSQPYELFSRLDHLTKVADARLSASGAGPTTRESHTLKRRTPRSVTWAFVVILSGAEGI
jgi:hypothetical protein